MRRNLFQLEDLDQSSEVREVMMFKSFPYQPNLQQRLERAQRLCQEMADAKYRLFPGICL